ncbi:MAG: branched-chain amino acid transport system II carrier protein [Vescimonas sp.]
MAVYDTGKLVNRIGHFLTPSLLVLLVFLFVCFLFRER